MKLEAKKFRHWIKSRIPRGEALAKERVLHASDFLLQQLKKGLILTSLIITFFSMVSFSNNIVEPEHASHKIVQIEESINSLSGTINVDIARERSISKITRIINMYNPQMPSKEKYRIANEIYEMTIKYQNLDIDLICATITHESALTWRPDIQSWAGALGLMQIMPKTGMFLCELEGIKWTDAEDVLYNPISNIRLGCRYLSMLIESYQLVGGLAAYNGGEKRVALWLARGRDNTALYRETRRYIPAVLRFYEIFKMNSNGS